MLIILFLYLGITCLVMRFPDLVPTLFGIFFILFALHRLRMLISRNGYKVYCWRRNKFTKWIWTNV
jgi:membrane-bound ClpP family serine protease